MPLSTINSNIDYSFKHIFTKYGTFGVKVWLFLYNSKYKKNKYSLNFNKLNKLYVSPTTIKKIKKRKKRKIKR